MHGHQSRTTPLRLRPKSGTAPVAATSDVELDNLFEVQISSLAYCSFVLRRTKHSCSLLFVPRLRSNATTYACLIHSGLDPSHTGFCLFSPLLLALDYCHSEQISNLDSLRKLDVLDLHSNAIRSMDGLDNLQHLRVLNIAGNHLRYMISRRLSVALRVRLLFQSPRKA